MVSNILIADEYKNFIIDIKSKIKSSQIRVATTVNSALLVFYWELGEMISLKQKESKWGSKLIQQIAKDFPELKGFSRTNLFYIKKFYEFYEDDLVQRRVGLNKNILFSIPWRHHIEIFNKVSSTQEAFFYIEETLKNSWSRDSLALNIKSNLFKRDRKRTK